MTIKELKSYIDRVLGSSLRCLLPSYWWKRLFGLLVDKVDEVEKTVGKKQEKLVSGETIKTINGEDILGGGNIEIKSSGVDVVVDAELDKTSSNPIANKAVANALEDKASKIYVTDEIGKVQFPVDTELSEDSTNAIANSAVTAALDGKKDKEEVYEIDLGECSNQIEFWDKLEEALIAYGKPQTGSIKLTGKIFCYPQNSEAIGYISFEGSCSSDTFIWKDDGSLNKDRAWLELTDNGRVGRITFGVYEDYMTLTVMKGGIIVIGNEAVGSTYEILYNIFVVNEGAVADEFSVAYNDPSNIVQVLEKRKGSGGLYVTVLHNGAIEEWRVVSRFENETFRSVPELVSSTPIGGDIDTSNFATKQELNDKQDKIYDLANIRTGAALGATALQSVPTGYVTTTDLQTEINLVERQITGLSSTIPTKTSQLDNDSGLATENYVNQQVRNSIISALNTDV